MLDWFETKKNKDGKECYEYWLKDFAIEKRITENRLRGFQERSEYFKNIYHLCKQIQEKRLFSLGLDTKGAMPIFALKNVSGWRGEPDENKDKEHKPIQLEVIEDNQNTI